MQNRLFSQTTPESKDSGATPISREDELIGLLLKHTERQYRSFEKPREHFTEAEYYKLSTPDERHSAVSFTKKNKSERWLEITTIRYDQKKMPTHCRFVAFMGDVMRQELGGLAPKYRYVTYPDGRLRLITKHVKNSHDYFDILVARAVPGIKIHTHDKARDRLLGTYDGKNWFDGICAAVYLKLLYNDDDMHFGNFLIVNINGKPLLVPIDNDRCLWPLPVSLFAKECPEHGVMNLPKRVEYDSDHHDAECHRDRKHNVQEYCILHHVTHSQNGELTERDLVTLPIMQDRTPNTYQFMLESIRPFFEAAAKAEVGKNEVSYHRLKTYLLTFLTRYKRAYHFEREKEFVAFGKKVEKEIKAIHDKVRELTHTSESLKAYLGKNRLAFMQTIIYDMNTDFYDNHHYQPQSKAVWQQAWNTMVEMVIDKFNGLLKIHGLDVLRAEEIEQLKKFAETCETNYSEACQTAAKFHESQKRIPFAESERMMLEDRLKSRAKRFKAAEVELDAGLDLYGDAEAEKDEQLRLFYL